MAVKVRFGYSDVNAHVAVQRIFTNKAMAFTPELVAHEKKKIEQMKKRAIWGSSQRKYVVGTQRPGPYGYSSKRGPLPGPAHLANIQNSTLGKSMSESWETDTRVEGGGIVSDLTNTAPHSRFFGGEPTEKMISRPLAQWIVKRSVKEQERMNVQFWHEFWGK